MGLDMFAYSVKPENATSPLEIKANAERTEIHYWRKHHDLHGWMTNLWKSKQASQDELKFNCQPLQLSLPDLKELENAIKTNTLPNTTGFFFGNNPPDPQTSKDDLKFIAKARKEIRLGNKVYYDSWW